MKMVFRAHTVLNKILLAVAIGAMLPAAAVAGPLALSHNFGGIFPGFSDWVATPGPALAVGVYSEVYANGQTPHYEFQLGSGTQIDFSQSVDGGSSQTVAQASMGTNRALAAAGRVAYASGNSYAISLWKDRFIVSGDGVATFKLHADGTVPLIPNGVPPGYGGAQAFYEFGVLRLSDSRVVASFEGYDAQSNSTASSYSTWLGQNDLQTGNVSFQARTGGPEVFDIALMPYLAAGEYEMQSALFVNASNTDLARNLVVDFLHTASFSGVSVSGGATLTSSSGLMTELSPGEYGYAVTAVPEPETHMLFLTGLGLMGLMVRRRKTAQAER